MKSTTPKIGIIEDDSALREGLALAFELEGYETAAAGTLAGRDGGFLEAGGLALLILDCNLPDGSGFDLVRQLRASSRLPVLSADGPRFGDGRGEGAGAGGGRLYEEALSPWRCCRPGCGRSWRRQEEPALFFLPGTLRWTWGRER